MRISDWSSDVCSSDLVTPQVDQTVYILQENDSLMHAEGNVRMLRDDDGQLQVTADSFDVATAPGVPPQVHHEVIRIRPGLACKGQECYMQTLLSALRLKCTDMPNTHNPTHTHINPPPHSIGSREH